MVHWAGLNLAYNPTRCLGRAVSSCLKAGELKPSSVLPTSERSKHWTWVGTRVADPRSMQDGGSKQLVLQPLSKPPPI